MGGGGVLGTLFNITYSNNKQNAQTFAYNCTPVIQVKAIIHYTAGVSSSPSFVEDVISSVPYTEYNYCVINSIRIDSVGDIPLNH